MSTRAFLLAGILALASGRLPGQVPSEERIPIRDPNRLQDLGFPRDAKNVYVWSKASLKDTPGLDEKDAATPETWGTATGYTTIQGFELHNDQEDWIKLWKDLSGVSCTENSSFGRLLASQRLRAHRCTRRSSAQVPDVLGVRLGSRP